MASAADSTPRTPAVSAPLRNSSRAASAARALRVYFAADGALPLKMALAVVAVFIPVVLISFASPDDSSFLWMAVSGEPSPQFGESIIQQHGAGGRVVNGVLSEIAFRAAGSIDHLRYLRLISVVGIAGLALVLHAAMVRAAIRPGMAALVAVLICSMPPLQVYATWTLLFAAPYAAVLAGAASMVTARVAGRHPRDAAAPLSIAVALLLTSLFIYQPPAMFFWVFLAIALVGAVGNLEHVLRIVAAHFAVAAVALALAYVSLKLTILYLGEDTPGAARSELSYDVVGRLRWFGEQPLYQALNLFDLTPTQWGAALTAVVAAGGMLIWLVLRARQPLVYVAIGIALVPLCYLPNLVIKDTWPPFRTQAALSALIALYVALGALGAWTVANDWLRPRLNRGEYRLTRVAAWLAAVGVIAASCVLAASNVTNLAARPLNTELRMLRGQVRALPPEVPRVTFVFTDWYGGMTDFVAYDELGLPFAARPWAAGPTIQLILREEGRLTSTYRGPAIDYYKSGSTQFPPNQPVLDLRGLRNLR